MRKKYKNARKILLNREIYEKDLLEKNCQNYEKRANICQKLNIIKKKFKN